MGWAPEGTSRRGWPKDTGRWLALKRLKTSGMASWSDAAMLAKDRE